MTFEDVDHVVGQKRLGEPSEPADVGEEHRDGLFLFDRLR